jgi:tetratricopeptide (TPR) repeat protein
MKKILFISSLAVALVVSSCKKTDFADSYTDPSKIAVSSVEKQFSGFVNSNLGYIMPGYWNYFVVQRITNNRYTQSVGWSNATGQYIPGGGAVSDHWNSYYNFLSQYKELVKINKALSPADQAERRIFMIAATIYFYDYTQKMVDVHGDLPWSGAGMLSANGGDYLASLPKYDKAQDIYTKMLDDLKAFSTELNSLTIPAAIQTAFNTQDFILKGSKAHWTRYCNSLRLRMLTRVSGSTEFAARATSEIAAMATAPATFPMVSSNAENVQINVFSLNTPVAGSNFQGGLEDWNGNLANATMINHMLTNGDPRLPVLFEPGDKAAGVYKGIDQMAAASVTDALILTNTVAMYNRSTTSRNFFFPGILINAAEVSFHLAEAHLKAGNLTAAKDAYNKGIEQSTEQYYNIRKLTTNTTSPAVVPYTAAQVTAYQTAAGINWDLATTTAARQALISNQRWLHYNVIQPFENYAEVRRTDLPALKFWNDDATPTNVAPPTRWAYPSSENVYNKANYAAVSANDKATNKIFWDK